MAFLEPASSSHAHAQVSYGGVGGFGGAFNALADKEYQEVRVWLQDLDIQSAGPVPSLCVLGLARSTNE